MAEKLESDYYRIIRSIDIDHSAVASTRVAVIEEKRSSDKHVALINPYPAHPEAHIFDSNIKEESPMFETDQSDYLADLDAYARYCTRNRSLVED